MKTDYKNRASAYEEDEKRINPSFLRFMLISGVVIVSTLTWYQRQNIALSSLEPLESTAAFEDESTSINQILDDAIIGPASNREALSIVAAATEEPNENESNEYGETTDAEQAVWATYKINNGKNLSYYLSQEGVSAKEIHQLLNVKHKKHLATVYPGQTIRFTVTPEGHCQQFEITLTPLQTLKITRLESNHFDSEIVSKPVETRTAIGGANIHDSFYLAGKKAQLNDALIMELANIFAYDIDFALDIRPKDSFKVIYEEQYSEGEKIGNGRILAAEFINNGKRYSAISYENSQGKMGYYTKDGRSLKKAFIRTPVEYTRISSHFNLQRRHPVLHHIRAHKGVDYAAPIGTPVKAAGDGKVRYVGKKGGYGNVIILQHGKKYTTLYAHLHKFHKQLHEGMHVKQGQVIGYVGKTGLASGPHLHYEFRVNDVHQNPLTVTLPNAEPVPSSEKHTFLTKVIEYQKLFSVQENVMIANNEI